MDNNWKIKRGSKIKYNEKTRSNIDFENIEKKIIMVVDIQMKNIIDNQDLNIKNKFSEWVVI
jgi:hypothetical protein